jgi:hypothetical protein
MPAYGSLVYRLFGGAADTDGRQEATSQTQRNAELLTVSATANARMVKGPKTNGHFSYHLRNVTASGATSAFTVWYSNLPDPDPTLDADWVQDTTITSVDLTVVANTFINVGNVNAEWVRFKPVVVTSAGTITLFVRVEGINNR